MEDKERPIKGNTYSIKVELCNNDTDNKSSSDTSITKFKETSYTYLPQKVHIRTLNAFRKLIFLNK